MTDFFFSRVFLDFIRSHTILWEFIIRVSGQANANPKSPHDAVGPLDLKYSQPL